MIRMRPALALVLLLAGCGHSPPTRLLTLDLAPPAARPAYQGPPLRLTAVQIPPAIDRLEFVSATAPTELRVEDQYRWSASLGSLAREALLRDLAARLPEGTVLPPDAGAAPGVARVDVAILALATTPQGTSMDAIVTVTMDGSKQSRRRQLTLQRPLMPGQTPADAAAQTSQMLGEVADGIILLVRQIKPGV